jgi:putative SOS response-associated peptidase YedK
MCGRFTLATPPEAIQDLFKLDQPPEVLRPRYNVAPRQLVAVVQADTAGGRRFEMFSWGLLRSWAKDQKLRPINAMAETVATKPMFRDLFARRRCLVPCDGFYEWRATAGGKQPFHIRLAGGALMAFAGLWDEWAGPGGEVVSSCCVITTEANELVRAIHDRMPVIVPPADFDRWLHPKTSKDELVAMLRPYPADRMEAVPVRPIVNTVQNEGPELLEPAA